MSSQHKQESANTEKIKLEYFLKQDIKFESARLSFSPTWNFNSVEIAKQANHLEIALARGDSFSFPFTVENADGFKVYTKTSWENGTEFQFGICKKDTLEYIGNLDFKISADEKTVLNIGYWLGKDFHGQGFATETLKKVIDFILQNFKNVEEIRAFAYDTNTASLRVMEKCGFVKTGNVEEKEIKRPGHEKIIKIVRLVWKK